MRRRLSSKPGGKGMCTFLPHNLWAINIKKIVLKKPKNFVLTNQKLFLYIFGQQKLFITFLGNKNYFCTFLTEKNHFWPKKFIFFWEKKYFD